MAARRMGEILGGKGKVGVIGFMAGSASTMEREDGFHERDPAAVPRDRDRRRAVRHGGSRQGHGGDGKHAHRAPRSRGHFRRQRIELRRRRAGGQNRATSTSVKLVAIDASDQLLADFRVATIDSIVVQNPFRMGYESTGAIGMKLAANPRRRLQEIPARRWCAGKIWTSPEIKALLLSGYSAVFGVGKIDRFMMHAQVVSLNSPVANSPQRTCSTADIGRKRIVIVRNRSLQILAQRLNNSDRHRR